MNKQALSDGKRKRITASSFFFLFLEELNQPEQASAL